MDIKPGKVVPIYSEIHLSSRCIQKDTEMTQGVVNKH